MYHLIASQHPLGVCVFDFLFCKRGNRGSAKLRKDGQTWDFSTPSVFYAFASQSVVLGPAALANLEAC